LPNQKEFSSALAVQTEAGFDGLGNTIGNLTINLPATADIGLFGSTGTASVIRNVGLLGGSVLGLSSAGGLVGSNTGTISDSYNTGTVSGGNGMRDHTLNPAIHGPRHGSTSLYAGKRCRH
jgi:hypothetical protein